MTKYFVLYHMPPEGLANMPELTPEQVKAAMEPWMTWATKCGNSLIDLGTPLGGGMSLSQAGILPSKFGIAGYSILEAESMDAALALLEDHPHSRGDATCSIEVHEAQPIPGM